jgi:hypothetical protein
MSAPTLPAAAPVVPQVRPAQELEGPHTEQRLVHLLWYVGTALSLAALTVYARTIAEGHPMRLAWVLIAYTVAALTAATVFLGRERMRNILTGLLVTAAILAGAAAWLIVQAEYHALLYLPLFDGYRACGGVHVPDCTAHPPYYLISLLDQLRYSPLGVVTLASVASVLGLAAFRFLPMIIVTVLGLWYWIFDTVAPQDHEGNLRCLMWCGILTLLVSWLLDRRFVNNYGFWVNKLGAWGVAGGLVYLFENQSEEWRLVYLLLNIVGMLVALYLKRSGGVLGFLVGAFSYIGYEYTTHFRDSLIFPYVLLVVGALVIYWGYALHRARRDLDVLYPKVLENWRPKERHERIFFGTESLLEMLSH